MLDHHNLRISKKTYYIRLFSKVNASLFLSTLCYFTVLTESSAQNDNEDGSKFYIYQDLKLPDWGPYTKKYIGVSHIPNVEKGIRFDLSVFPGFYRRKVEVPNVMFETSYHPWMATSDLELFTFRHELEWKDRIYADISYLKHRDDASRLIRIELVNNTKHSQNLVMNFMTSVHFPSIREYKPNIPIQLTKVTLPKDGLWIDAVDYKNLAFGRSRPQDNLVYDGKFNGEIRDHGFVQGRGIGSEFGRNANDRLEYVIGEKISTEVQQTLLMRYRMKEDETCRLTFSGLVKKEITLKGTGAFALLSIPVDRSNTNISTLEIISKGGSAMEIDGFVIAPSKSLGELEFKEKKWEPAPEIIPTDSKNSLILKYKDIDEYYGINWDFDDYVLREVFAKDLDIFYRRATNSHVATKLYGEGDGHFTNVFMRPITMVPESRKIMYGTVHTGTLEKVKMALSNEKWDNGYFEKAFSKQVLRAMPENVLASGQPKLLGNQLMAATVATNVVYPVYTQKNYIRHRAPGRWWDCLYTWDSGFIGLGLLESDIDQAIDNLEAYVMDVDAQSAFLHHGTPIPVQHYLYQAIWNRSQSKDFLKTYYPGLKRYHEFLTGKESSTTKTLKSGLLKTWDYFYNSGGWDDYPPQSYVHENSMEHSVAPVVNTAHTIRTAKILKQAASILGYDSDIASYDKDIEHFSKALHEYAWDKDEGYFGYVNHDNDGNADDILRTPNGENYNKGLGGAYPLISGICTEQQRKALLSHLKTKGQIWSDIGLSAVDQTSTYYKNDGYWNGTVWMPHQWFFYKAMLDLGESDFAHKIAKTALDVWEKEVDATYNCMEHFVIETGRGAGWHQFGALSSPVLSWFSSYYKKGRITTGHDLWVMKQDFNTDFTALSLVLNRSEVGEGKSTVVIIMDENRRYELKVNGLSTDFQVMHPGALSVDVPNSKRVIDIEISPLKN